MNAKSRRTHQQYAPVLAISAHGIRTHGHWQKDFSEMLSGSPTRVANYDYGRYGILRFITPGFNDRKIDEFYGWYSATVSVHPDIDLRRHDRRPCLVAHSFGTWVTCNAMLRHSDIRFEKVILCGSILPCDFDWAKLFSRDQVTIVRNERGLKDPWPVWASRFIPRAGASGSKGFAWFESVVEDVVHDQFGHHAFLSRAHMEDQWLPFLRRPPSPLFVRHGRTIESGAEFRSIFRDTDVIDAGAFGANYNETYVSDELALEWVRVNPDIYTFLADKATTKTVGYINAMPVEDEIYETIRQGRIADNEIPASKIIPFERNRDVKLYLMSIGVSEEYRQWGQGLWHQGFAQLVSAVIDKLTDYAKHRHIRVTHLLAVAWTPQGSQICKCLAMSEVGKDRFGDAIFEVELKKVRPEQKGLLPSFKRLLRLYGRMKNAQG